MFFSLLILQCSLSVLIILSILLQKSGKESMGGLKVDPMGMPESTNRFLVKITSIFIGAFFVNAIILANLSCKPVLKNNNQNSTNYYQNTNTKTE